MTFVKLSIAIYLLQLSQRFPWRRIILYVLLFSTTSSGIIYTTVLAAVGTTNVVSPTSATLYPLTSAAWNVIDPVSGLLLAIVALVALLGIDLPRQQKMQAGAIVLVGTLAGIASCIKLSQYLLSVAHTTPSLSIMLQLYFWSITEAGLSISAANLIQLSPIITTYISKTKEPSVIDGHTSSLEVCNEKGEHIPAVQVNTCQISHGLRKKSVADWESCLKDEN